jgi:outer membrane protein insertion porin family
MELFKRIIIAIFGIAFLAGISSCSNLKFVPKDDALYLGAKVNLKGSDIPVREKKVLRADLQGLTRPKPNSNILGMRIKLFANHIPFLRKKFAEPPVLLSSVDLEHNTAVLTNHLENKGYFRAQVQADTSVKKRKATATYDATPGPQYKIKEVVFESDTGLLQQNINAAISRSLLRAGDPFNLEAIKDERRRIDAYLKERGFYYFSPDYLIIQTDTTIGNAQVNLYVKLKPETPAAAREIYYIGDVYVYSNYSLNRAGTDTSKGAAIYHDGFYVVDRRRRHKPIIFEQALQFRPNDVYNRTDHNISLNRLINLNIFKFVKNRFQEAPSVDTPKLDAYYYLTPFPRQSLRAEISGHTKSNNLTGSQITLSWRNRNTFRGGELLTINASVGSEYQFSGLSQAFNTYRLALDATIAWPRFVVPFFDIRMRRSPFVPRTNLELGYEAINRARLYTLNSFRAGLGYVWKESAEREHQFYPISVNFVQPANVTPLYDSVMAKNPTLQKVVERQFILGSYYIYNVNQLLSANRRANSFYFNGLADISGNIAGLVVKKDETTDSKELFGSAFAQYIKGEADFRYYRQVGLNTILANRIIFGFGYPYGNSRELPFIKQFFVGGTNSVRAFRSRSLGPGTYRVPDTTLFLPDQSGDIKLELNSEFRAKLYSVIHGALFIDAGNVWLYNDNPLKPGGKFDKEFLSELAVGAGAGIRIDVSFFVLRLDLAFPLRKPYLPKGERWVFNEIDFGNKDWRKQNLVFNLGIGYPF